MQLKQKLALEFDRAIRGNEKKMHVLRQLFWECTLRCNLRCLHCGSDCKGSSIVPDMPKDVFLRVIDEQITPHVNPIDVLIIISGGEPLMRDDLEEIGGELKKRGYRWGMVTNGMLMTQERFDALKNAGLKSVAVSLDGLENEHNWMRGNANSFKNAMRTINILSSQDEVIWDVVTCVNKRNIDYLPQLKDLLYDSGVRKWRIFTIFPAGRAKETPELMISDEQLRYVLDFIVDCKKEGKIQTDYACEGFLGDYEGKVRDHLYRCFAGINVASILIDGSISACTSIRGKYYQGNIYKDDFWKVWNNGFKNYRDRGWMKKGKCGDCKMFRYCEGGGMHLRDEQGNLLMCHYERIKE